VDELRAATPTWSQATPTPRRCSTICAGSGRAAKPQPPLPPRPLPPPLPLPDAGWWLHSKLLEIGRRGKGSWRLAAHSSRLHSQLLQRGRRGEGGAGGWRLAAPLQTSRDRSEGEEQLAAPLPTSQERSKGEGRGWRLAAGGSRPISSSLSIKELGLLLLAGVRVEKGPWTCLLSVEGSPNVTQSPTRAHLARKSSLRGLLSILLSHTNEEFYL
jgi:hypothetical protein